MAKDYDFSGWATRNNLRCSDGRTIIKDAFKHNDGTTVPLVWNHQHNESTNVLGHALLENREEGVYAYCKFNETEAGKNAKMLVEHGDVTSLSIYANQLKQQGHNVIHGAIREVSLVLAGANPGAFIDSIIVHGEESGEEAVVYTGEDLVLTHSDETTENNTVDNTELNHSENNTNNSEDNTTKKEKTVQEVFDTLTEEQKNVVYALIGSIMEEKETNPKQETTENDTKLNHSENSTNDTTKKEKTVQEVFDTLTEEQKNVVYALIGSIMEEKEAEPKQETIKEEKEMKHNVFENENTNNENTLKHADVEAAFAEAKRYGSLRESCLAHGITDINKLFSVEGENLNKTPEFISRQMGWVKNVMHSVRHTPFSRVKSQFANITGEEARARGYITTKLKKEEFFSLIKRTTTPTTVYKKQKLDRDDMLDITDFDVVAWLKTEMRMMLDEELARAFLIGDGREDSDDDHINHLNIRPIATDEELYTVQSPVSVAANATADEKAKAFIRTVIKSRKEYKGTGSPTLYTTSDVVSDCLLLEDKNGRVIYETVDKLAKALRVAEIVEVPVMENAKGKTNKPLLAVLVNLADYNVGADKGGNVNMFDDFDIDYNAQKYLIETRCSGALIKPYSAIAYELHTAE